MKAVDFGRTGRLAWQIALLALIALLNPYTLFGRDPGRQYWLAAFLLPLLLAATLALALRHRPNKPCFARIGWQASALVLLLQWADV